MKKVVRNPLICSGAPTLTGTRLTVFDIMEGVTLDSLLNYSADFDIKIDDILECANYCMELQCKKSKTHDNIYCYRCTLNSTKENYDDITQFSENGINFIKNGTSIFVGTMDEYWESEEKKQGWILAENILLSNI